MRIQFEARECGTWAKDATGTWKRRGGNWRVFDTISWSFPYSRPGVGKILQDTTEAQARAEADRLNGVAAVT